MVIDELVLAFSLDPSKFSKGQQEIIDKAKGLEEMSRRAAVETENQAKRTTDYFQNLKRGALEVIAAFAGIKGVIGLIDNTTKSMTAMGLVAERLGMQSRVLGGWEGAAQKLGLPPGTATGAFQGLQREIIDNILQGKVGPGLGFLSRLAPIYDPKNRESSLAEIFLRAAESVRRDFKTVPEQVGALTKIPGVSEEFASLLLRGREQIEASVRDSEELRKITPELVAGSRALTEAEKRFTQALEGGGNKLMEFINGPLATFFNTLSNFLKEHPEIAAPLEIVHQASGGLGGLAETVLGVLGLKKLYGWLRGGAARAGTAALEGAGTIVTESGEVIPGVGARATATAAGGAALARLLGMLLGVPGAYFAMTTPAGAADEPERVRRAIEAERRREGRARFRIPGRRPSANLSDADVTFLDPSGGGVVTLPRYGAPAAAAGFGERFGGGVTTTVGVVNVNAPGVRNPNEATAAGITAATERGLEALSMNRRWLSQVPAGPN